MTTTVGQEMRIANDLYLVLHHRNGRRQTPKRTAGVALSAALLAELVLRQRIAIVGGMVTVQCGLPVGDGLLDDLIGDLLAQPRVLHVNTWLTYLRRDAEALVAKRMQHAGRLRSAQCWWWFRPRSVPIDVIDAAWQSVRIGVALEGEQKYLADLAWLTRPADLPRLTETDTVLAGLIAACGMLPAICYHDPSAASDRLKHLLDNQLRPALAAIVRSADTAIASLTLSGRA